VTENSHARVRASAEDDAVDLRLGFKSRYSGQIAPEMPTQVDITNGYLAPRGRIGLEWRKLPAALRDVARSRSESAHLGKEIDCPALAVALQKSLPKLEKTKFKEEELDAFGLSVDSIGAKDYIWVGEDCLRPFVMRLGVMVHGCAVLQEGPFGSTWLRIRRRPCVRLGDVEPPAELVKQAIQRVSSVVHQEAEERSCALWVSVSEGAMHASTLQLLREQDFVFHHTRGYNDPLLPSPSSETVEFAFYKWVGKEQDRVPPYSSSIEGVVGLILSPDGQQVLCVWEGGCYQMPGGALHPGEDLFSALARELQEELGVELDVEHSPLFLGGYQSSNARDARVNDHFAVLCVRAASTTFMVDNEEISEAAWLPCGFDGAPGILTQWYNREERAMAQLDIETGRPLSGSTKLSMDWQGFARDSKGKPRPLRARVVHCLAALDHSPPRTLPIAREEKDIKCNGVVSKTITFGHVF